MKETEALVQKINELVIRQRKPYIEQYRTSDGSVRWYERKQTLTDTIVTSHIEGKRTIGCFYAGKASSFLVFDIDSEDDPIGQEIRTKGIVHALLEAGIAKEDVHVSTSGKKGYHVELYFDGLLPIQRLAKFGKALISQLREYTDGIEIRPEALAGRGIKLPLATHQATGRRQEYVDPMMMDPIEDSVSYFLGIRQIPKEKMDAVIDAVLSRPVERYPLEPAERRVDRGKKEFASINMPKNRSSKLRKEAEDLLENGLKEKGTRNASQFKIALLLRENGVSLEEAIDVIKKWAMEQYHQQMTKERNVNRLLKEAERTVRSVYENENYVGLVDSRGRIPTITMDDLAYASQFRNKNVRKVVWALIMIGRIYHENGEFAASMEGMAEMTGLSRQTVSKILQSLIADGIIQKISEYDRTKRIARRYFMTHLVGEVRPPNTNRVRITSDTIGAAYRETLETLERFAKRGIC